MNLNARVRALTKRADRVTQSRPVASMSVCARIEELTREYAEHPPVFRPEIKAGIMAAVDRQSSTES